MVGYGVKGTGLRSSGVALAEAFNPRRNSLNFLRLLLAATVIVAHAWPIGYGVPSPSLNGTPLGEFAVAGFFAISGYLITGSRVATGAGRYLWRRFLRIYPSYWVCLLLTAFALAPLVAIADGGAPFDGVSAARYVSSNASIQVLQEGISGTLESVPYKPVWNGSLWTLAYEVACYLGLAVLLAIPAVRRRPVIVVALLALVTVAQFSADRLGVGSVVIGAILRLAPFFIAGTVLRMYRDRVPVSWPIAAGSAVLITASAALGQFWLLGPLPVAYLCLWLGVVLPFHRVGSRNDISYGVYIYGFPVQQALAVFGAQRAGVLFFILAGLLATVPFAAASWFLIEKPAMRLKSFTMPRRSSSPAREPAI